MDFSNITWINSPPLCSCGCGNLVKWNKEKKDWNKYINYHNKPTNDLNVIEKMSKAKKGKKQSPELIEKRISKIRGSHRTEETKQKMRKPHGPMKEETKKLISDINMNKIIPLEIRKAISTKIQALWSDPEYRNYMLGIRKEKNSAQKGGRKLKENWKDPEYKEKHMKIMFHNLKVYPNKPEIMVLNLLNNLYPDQWEYTGDFSFWVNGKNPDFRHKTQNKLIEVYGDYWHKGDNPEDRKIVFREKGYETLIFWQSELKDMDFVLFQLEEFMKQDPVIPEEDYK